MNATLNILIEKRNSLRAERADLLQKMNDWELAEIVGSCIDSLLAVVPHNHREYLGYLKERAESLAEED